MYMCTDTNDMNNLLNGISNMTPYGMTALYDALVTGIYNASSRTGPNCVIAFTDGIDNQSTYTYSEVIQLALEKGIPLRFGSPTNQVFLSLDAQTLARLGECVEYSFWEMEDAEHTVIRLAASWATREEDLEALIRLL